jgi:stage II sporulation protein AA (anti-sigma F factor antagonist)
MHTSEVFRQKADAEMVSGAIKNLVLVMSSVSFIDSSGVGAIIGRYRTVKDRQGKMVLVGLRPAVRRVLDMSGVLGIADATDTERHALARL